uniref:Uncharacterized protein n=1 Tax=Leptocylindrus danicus TaxID=163516 RepID=A0A6U2LI11_9STRA|mmetsp:Transcript_13725/g.20369  ORF Transcript_13725/g.20369 Transcript_13725/m.20369 type:complete len:192 (+) Transcript_13725:448-1023(+)
MIYPLYSHSTPPLQVPPPANPNPNPNPTNNTNQNNNNNVARLNKKRKRRIDDDDDDQLLLPAAAERQPMRRRRRMIHNDNDDVSQIISKYNNEWNSTSSTCTRTNQKHVYVELKALASTILEDVLYTIFCTMVDAEEEEEQDDGNELQLQCHQCVNAVLRAVPLTLLTVYLVRMLDEDDDDHHHHHCATVI